MKRITMFFLIFIISIDVYCQVDDDIIKDKKEIVEKKITDYVKFEISSKTTAEFKFVDTSNDAKGIVFSVAKNTPIFTEEFETQLSFIIEKHKNLILGLYGYSELEAKMDYKSTTNNSQFIFEEFSSIGYAGVKVGTKFGNYAIKDSSISFIVPFMVKFNINDRKDTVIKPVAINTLDYFTHLYLGTNFVILLDIVSKIYNFRINYENQFAIAGDLFNNEGGDVKNILFFEERNILKFEVLPFNFIHKDIDISFILYNRNIISYDSFLINIKNRSYFKIGWDGLKYFELSYKPLIYNFEIKYTLDDINEPFDQLQSFSTEIGVVFGNKNFKVELSYEPIYWILYRNIVNEDNIKDHTLKGSILLKF